VQNTVYTSAINDSGAPIKPKHHLGAVLNSTANAIPTSTPSTVATDIVRPIAAVFSTALCFATITLLLLQQMHSTSTVHIAKCY
jgi:hypothetical protein